MPNNYGKSVLEAPPLLDTVDERNPAPVDMVNKYIIIIYRISYIPGGAEFLPLTVSFDYNAWYRLIRFLFLFFLIITGCTHPFFTIFPLCLLKMALKYRRATFPEKIPTETGCCVGRWACWMRDAGCALRLGDGLKPGKAWRFSGWWQLKDFLFSPLFGEDESNLTSIFFKGVGSTTN